MPVAANSSDFLAGLGFRGVAAPVRDAASVGGRALAAADGGNANLDPSSLLSGFLRSSFRTFVEDTQGLREDQINSLNDTSITQAGIDGSARANELSAESARINSARVGLGLSAAQRASLSKQSRLSSATSSANTINNARLAQRDRNENLALQLSEQRSQLKQQSLDNLLQANGLSGARNRNNSASRQAASQANVGTAMSLASLAVSI